MVPEENKVEKPMTNELQVGDYIKIKSPGSMQDGKIGKIIEQGIGYNKVTFLKDQLSYHIGAKYCHWFEGIPMPNDFKWEEGDIIRYVNPDFWEAHNKTGHIINVDDISGDVRTDDGKIWNLSHIHFRLIHRPKNVTKFEPQYGGTFIYDHCQPSFRPGDMVAYSGAEECYKGMKGHVIKVVKSEVMVRWIIASGTTMVRKSRRSLTSTVATTNLSIVAKNKKPTHVRAEGDYGSFGFRGTIVQEFMG